MVLEENIDYESLGKWIRRVREKHKMTQEQAAKEFHVSRTVLSRYESGKVRPRWEDVERFAKKYHENPEEIRKKVSIVIPDTCALRKNKRLLHMLLEDYDKVVLPTTVMMELSRQKNRGLVRSSRRLAWQILADIDYYVTEYPERFKKVDSEIYREEVERIYQDKDPKSINDYIIIALAKRLAKKTIGDVVVITDDIDLTTHYKKAIKIDDYVARRTKTIDYEKVLEFDKAYKNLSLFQKNIQTLDINAYLPDGMTLLISCIRCRTKEKTEQLGWRPSEKEKYEKLQFLMEYGADIDKNDNARYCLPPLAHCVQIDDWRAFQILLEAGCDYNKASRDERMASYMKVGKLNEGNTPLMIACWSGRRKYVEKLCSYSDISLNQQDSNGYTALIKCAVARYNRKKARKSYGVNESLFRYLQKRGADPLIRDRNNHTAQDWWKRADNPEYKEKEQW